MAKPKFNIGEKVYAINNSVWGRSPMEVEKIYSHDYDDEIVYGCIHPNIGKGAFPEIDLSRHTASVTRMKKLKKLERLKKQVIKLEDELFGG